MIHNINWGKYFTEEEFKCRYTGNCNMDQYFIDQLNKLRDIYAKPITISSGYRDPTHPIEAKKKTPGAHASGMACDISVRGADALKIIHIALELNFTGIGVNQKGSGRFIHLDILNGTPQRPRPTIWSY
jgi:uncharacterized protein YcbK (DUF882 family)